MPATTDPADALRVVLETALDAVIVMRDDGVVAGWNHHAVTIFGWTREEAVGRAMADLIIPERYRAAHKNGLQRYVAGGEATVLGRRIEVFGMRKNGEEFPLELSIARVPGERLLFVGFLRDLTERNTLRQARAEVARMSQQMAMGQMAASIVQEINQPLAAITANAGAGERWISLMRGDLENHYIAVDTALAGLFRDCSQTGVQGLVGRLVSVDASLITIHSGREQKLGSVGPA